MNQFVRLGNIILNLDHVIEIQYQQKSETDRCALWITTAEIDKTQSSRILEFLDENAEKAWYFFCHALGRDDRKAMWSLDVSS